MTTWELKFSVEIYEGSALFKAETDDGCLSWCAESFEGLIELIEKAVEDETNGEKT